MNFCIQKVESSIKNDCNVSSIPDGLVCIAVDMAVGEFLTAKKTFSPDSIAGLDLDYAVKQIQTGDTNTMPILAVVTAVLVVLGAGLFIATRKKKNKK